MYGKTALGGGVVNAQFIQESNFYYLTGISESGAALIKKYRDLTDELFTAEGFSRYAEDLLERMTNPYLQDSVERASRDPLRKLGLTDRIFGTMRLALDQNIEPTNMAMGAAGGVAFLMQNADAYNIPNNLRNPWQTMNQEGIAHLLCWIWDGESDKHFQQLTNYVYVALKQLIQRDTE